MWSRARVCACLLLALGSALGCASRSDDQPSLGAGNGGSTSAGASSDGGRTSAAGDVGRAGTSAVAGGAGRDAGNAGTAGALTDNGGAGAGGAVNDNAGNGGTAPATCREPVSGGDQSHLTATEHVETYAVTGTTADQLRVSINQNRGHDYDALTTWNIAWSYQNCTSPQWAVSLSVVYDLPNWAAPASADAALVASWDQYIDALYCHEYGHGKLGLDCANSVYDALAALTATGDCDALTTRATATFQSILDDCKAREVQYDTDTMHGATMGAVFPP